MAEVEQTFEESLKKLETIVADLEDGRTGLDEALKRYEEGVGLIKVCYAKLEQAEQRILELTGIDAEGKPQTRPFEHSASVERETSEVKRRSRKSPE